MLLSICCWGKQNSLYDLSLPKYCCRCLRPALIFGEENPINRIIQIDHPPHMIKVAGIYEDFPQNSTLADLKFISSWDYWYKANGELKNMEDPWRPNFTSLFVEINDNADFDKVSAKDQRRPS